MKTRPILFSGEMVRAILDGRKRQTRRVIKPQPESDDGVYYWKGTFWDWQAFNAGNQSNARCPYGVTGDRLWLRETWGVHRNHNHIRPVDLPDMAKDYFGVSYRATAVDDSSWVDRWRPSIHMPKWASRITLEVTGVRVERVQDISEADAWAEGIDRTHMGRGIQRPVVHFRRLWDSINAKRGFGWDKDPWCWIVEFEVVK